MRLLALALLAAGAGFAADPSDPCAAQSTVADVRFTISLKSHASVFQEGEIIPLVLSFSSSSPGRYRLSAFFEGPRLTREQYCVDPQAPDPLATFFQNSPGIMGGGPMGPKLGTTPFEAEAELNEWRTLRPGRYRVYAISYRLGPPVRSNSLTIDITDADPQWQDAQLRDALQELAHPTSPDETSRASRVIRFLNSRDSTRELARLLADPAGPADYLFGIYGSPYRQLAIESMRAILAAPESPITASYLSHLVNLEISDEPRGQRRDAHWGELRQKAIITVVAALPQKIGRARALTVRGLLEAAQSDPGLVELVRRGLIASWADLAEPTREDLVRNWWGVLAGPEMLPILREMVAATPEPSLDAVLRRTFELDPTEAQRAIVRALEGRQDVSVNLVAVLAEEDRAAAARTAVERLTGRNARVLDYEIINRYASMEMLGAVRAAYEKGLDGAVCDLPALLRYFVRVAPEYGAAQVRAALAGPTNPACYRSQLTDLGEQLPRVQPVAIEALDNPELAEGAAAALGRWGTSEAEAELWKRAGLQPAAARALATGTNWLCPPEKLARLAEAVSSPDIRRDLEAWIEKWRIRPVDLTTDWQSDGEPRFSLLQYDSLTEQQFSAKLAQLPRGMELRADFSRRGNALPQVTLARQQEVFERLRAVAEQHGVLLQ